MSEELIKTLDRRLNEAESRKAELTVALRNAEKAEKRAKRELADLQASQDKAAAELRSQVEALTAERDQWKQRAESSPEETASRIRELESQIRERDHRDAWAKAIGKELHEKASIDDVWQKVGYKPDSDAIDEKAIGELVGKAKDSAPYLFVKADVPGNGTAPNGEAQRPVRPSPLTVNDGPSRGARDTASGTVTYSRSETKQAGWMNTPRGREIVEARRAGTAVLIDE